MNQGIIDIGWVTYKYFYYVTVIFLFPISPTWWSIKIFRNLSLALLGFYQNMWIWTCKISPKYVIWRWCLKRISWNWQEQYVFKQWVFQKGKVFYPFFQPTSYYNAVATKQIYFSPTIWKSWILKSDNIKSVVGGLWYN